MVPCSRAVLTALEEAAVGVQRTAPHATELQALLLARAQKRLQTVQAEMALLEREARLQQLEEDSRRLTQLEAGYQCVVCMDAPKSVCLLPCKHICMCQVSMGQEPTPPPALGPSCAPLRQKTQSTFRSE